MGASDARIVSRHLLPNVMHFVILGASLGSFYIVAMTMMGRRYRGADLIGVNTSFVFIWGVGAAVGPGMSGASMEFFGPEGMPALGMVLCVGFLLLCLRAPREEVPALNQTSRHT